MKIEELYSIFQQYPSVTTDTRKINPGDLFFALRGPSFNGNHFASQAIQSGAAFAIIDDASAAVEGKTILVDDVLTTLQQLALHHRNQFTIPFLAITGSNGKTTTKELIHAVLSTTFKTYTTEGNLNNHIGVPLTILKIKGDARMAVIEMGANHLREIASYCEIARPTHGLITNCGKAHLEGFGGVEGVRKGKGELFDFLRAHEGMAFIMKDYDYLVEMSAGIREMMSYGTHDADIEGNFEENSELLKVHFTKGLKADVQTQLVGSYNLPNALAAAAVGTHFGVATEKIVDALLNYTPTNSRSQLMKKGSNSIILDAYNANPSSMKAAVLNFAGVGGNNKILALGAMAELGTDSVMEHAELVKEIGRHQFDQVLLVGGDFLKLEHPYQSFKTPVEAGEWLRGKEFADAHFLIKGSRSMKMETLLDYL